MSDSEPKKRTAVVPLGSIQMLMAVHMFEPLRMEQDRLMMTYEDQLSHSTRRIGQLQEKCDKWKRYLRKTKDDYDQLQAKMLQIQQKHKSNNSSRQKTLTRNSSVEISNTTDTKEKVDGRHNVDEKKKVTSLRSPLPLQFTSNNHSQYLPLPLGGLENPPLLSSTVTTLSGEKRKFSAILQEENARNKSKVNDYNSTSNKHHNFDAATHFEFPESSVSVEEVDVSKRLQSKENIVQSKSNNKNNNNNSSNHVFNEKNRSRDAKVSPAISSRSLQLTAKISTSNTMPPPIAKPIISNNTNNTTEIQNKHKEDPSDAVNNNHNHNHNHNSSNSAISNNTNTNNSSNNPNKSDPVASKYTPKYIDVVRNKAAREALPGHTCRDCAAFYDAMVEQGIVNDSNRAMFLQSCSRHKAQWAIPDTPDSFWDISVNTPAAWK